MTSSAPLILAHGGAGLRRMTPAQATCLADALVIGYAILEQGGPALIAVECTIGLLEQSGLFNAGRGANRQLDGVQRMDASIMEGAQLGAGAVASIEGILHPITAARLVMEDTPHVLLVGPQATKFAQHCQLAPLFKARSPRRNTGRSFPSTSAAQTMRLYRAMLKSQRTGKDQHGTVGAVALDRFGTVAAGASTGGVDSMLPGRVGDSPLIGCGVYADNLSGAVSMTGVGEGIIRLVIAKAICDYLAMGKSPTVAARQVLCMLVSRIRGSAGALVLSPDGRFAIKHVTPYMAAGWWKGRGTPTVRGQFP